MSCERFHEAIAAHAAGAALEAAAASHLATCATCVARLDRQRRLLAEVDLELGELASLTASPGFVARATSRAPVGRRRTVAWRRAAWAGLAAAAAILVGIALRDPSSLPQPAVPVGAAVPGAPAQAPLEAPARTDAAPAPRTAGRPMAQASPDRRVAGGRPAVPPPAGVPTTAAAEPVVIVDPDQVRAIARLRELVQAGRLTEAMLPAPAPHVASELTVLPLEIPEITVPSIDGGAAAPEPAAPGNR